MTAQNILAIETPGRGTQDITDDVAQVIEQSGIQTGLCHIFSRHTSAGVIITENADPTVREDLERLLSNLAPDGWHEFRHTAEGEDDMSAHVRTLLTGDTVLVPIRDGRLALGTWQGIYLWEHRSAPHRREVAVTLLG